MDDNIKDIEKLICYLDNELTEAEEKVLKNELKDNFSLQQELDNLILTREVIKSYGLTQKVNGIHKTMMHELPDYKLTRKAVVRIIPKIIMKIAATILLLIGLFGVYEYLNISAGKLYEEKYMPYEVAIMRGSTTPNLIENTYKDKKFDSVIVMYQKIAQPTINEEFLTAQSYLSKADYNNAIKLFTAIIQENKISNTAMLNDDASYFLALTYLKNNQADKAFPIFEKIHNDNTQLYSSKINYWYLFKVKLLQWKQQL